MGRRGTRPDSAPAPRRRALPGTRAAEADFKRWVKRHKDRPVEAWLGNGPVPTTLKQKLRSGGPAGKLLLKHLAAMNAAFRKKPRKAGQRPVGSFLTVLVAVPVSEPMIGKGRRHTMP